MNKTIVRITSVILALTLTLSIFTSGQAKTESSSIMPDQTVNLAYFYKPPTNSDAATVAKNYDTVILTGGDESFRNQLVANGLTSTIPQYFGAIGIQDPGDCTTAPRKNQVAYNAGDFCAISRDHPDWFLLDTAGQRVLASPTSDTYRMDPGNAGWRNFFVTRVLEWQQKNGWSGLFLDNLEASVSDIQKYGKTLAKYPDDASYQAAIVGFIQYLKANYSQLYNRPVLANIIARRDEASWFKYMPYLDGAMQERWAVDWSTTVYITEAKWQSDLVLAEKTQSQGKYIILVAPGNETDTNRQTFAYASYLLIANGKATFRYSNAASYHQVWLYSNYQTDLGTPLGPRYQSGSLWRRDFTKGSVVVDPVNHTATISTGSSSSPTSAPITTTPSVPTATLTTLAPTNTPIQPTATPTRPTATPTIPPTKTFTATPLQPTVTPIILPTQTRVLPSETPFPPTATPFVPPTPTLALPTATPIVLPTQTLIQPTATTIQPTATPIVLPTETPVQATPTSLPTTTAIIQPTTTSIATVIPSAETIYDDKNSALVYSSRWQNKSTAEAYKGSYKLVTRNGASVTFTFTGQSFSILYKGGKNFGKMDVYVDGQLVGTLDQKLNTTTYQKRWDYPNQLALGQHTLKLVFKVTSSTLDYGSLDAVIVR